ncbi:MAG TPA: peroxidase-related enzyme [Candidatus Kapabacteria bacterium]|nr:peroxidase-related enzyme [Candidatus Kapabacteria bacterium]
MAYVRLAEHLPGIGGLLAYYTESAKPLTLLAQTMLRGENTLTPGERELIATYVSTLNNCFYCANSHGYAAKHLLNNDLEIVTAVQCDYQNAPINDKMKALLNIAGKVQQDGKLVLPEDIERARTEGATDKEIHDAVLIAAMFCMYNRYVDGLGTWQPRELDKYDAMGAVLAEQGYIRERK